LSNDTAEQAHLRHSILANLKSPAAQKIDFWCNGIHVDGGGFYAVYTSLVTDLLHVSVDRRLAARDIAKYSDSDNTFYFARANYGDRDGPVLEKALTIHESVHAMVDISFNSVEGWAADLASGRPSPDAFGYRPFLMVLQEEAVAYVAQALFIVNAIGRYDFPNPLPQLILAMRIADRIKDNNGATVTDKETSDLVNAIGFDPLYKNAPVWSQANGSVR
jgi:hypothetical protein